MAFYFALLNVSKKDNNINKEKKEKHPVGDRRHRRHSIASVESPLLDYRLLPRPQLLADDVVITNDLAQQMEMSSSSSHHNSNHDPVNRRSRGSARASKWVHDNHVSSSRRQQPQPSSSSAAQWGPEAHNPPHFAQPLARSKPMVFEGKSAKHDGKLAEDKEKEKQKEREKERRGRMRKKKSDDEEGASGNGKGTGQKTSSSEENKNGKKKSGRQEPAFRNKKDVAKTPTDPVKPKKQLGPTRKVQPTSMNQSASTSMSNPIQSSIAARRTQKTGQTMPNLKPVEGNNQQATRRRLVSEHFAKNGTATDESGRSSSQVSNESRTPRRDDSPESTCEEEETDKNSEKKESGLDMAMKLSGVSMSSRASEPRLKKVTFESSTYVISNSFLGEGAGKVLVVRRNSGSAVRRVSNDWSSKCGWWDQKDYQEKQCGNIDNQANKEIEKSQTRSILRRGLIRRRSTSDKSRLLAYRNSGFLSNSQERTPESTSLSASRMTVSVDCPKYQ